MKACYTGRSALFFQAVCLSEKKSLASGNAGKRSTNDFDCKHCDGGMLAFGLLLFRDKN